MSNQEQKPSFFLYENHTKHFDFNEEGLLKESRVGMLGATTYRYHLKHKKPEIQVRSLVKKINEINEKTTLKLNSVSIFNKKEEELFHYLAKYEKSF